MKDRVIKVKGDTIKLINERRTIITFQNFLKH